jgi:hypothetical protein
MSFLISVVELLPHVSKKKKKKKKNTSSKQYTSSAEYQFSDLIQASVWDLPKPPKVHGS